MLTTCTAQHAWERVLAARPFGGVETLQCYRRHMGGRSSGRPMAVDRELFHYIWVLAGDLKAHKGLPGTSEPLGMPMGLLWNPEELHRLTIDFPQVRFQFGAHVPAK